MVFNLRWLIVRVAARCVGLSRFLPCTEAVTQAKRVELALPPGVELVAMIVATKCMCPKCRIERGEPVAMPQFDPRGI